MCRRSSSAAGWLAGAVLSLGLAGTAPAGTAAAFADGFENGPTGQVSTVRDDVFDPLDINWYQDQVNAAVAVMNDPFAGGGSERALAMHPTGAGDTFRRVAGTFPTVALGPTVGDTVLLRLTLQVPTNAYALATNPNGLRIGLFDGKGTVVTQDWASNGNNPAVTDDVGYYLRIGTGVATNTEILKEPAAGDNPTGGANAPGTNLPVSVRVPVTINDSATHTFELAISRATVTSLALHLTFDGALIATATDNGQLPPSGLITNFSAVYIANGNVTHDLRIDNVQLVTTTAAPVHGSVLVVK